MAVASPTVAGLWCLPADAEAGIPMLTAPKKVGKVLHRAYFRGRGVQFAKWGAILGTLNCGYLGLVARSCSI